MKAYKTESDVAINSGNFLFLRIETEYNEIKTTTAIPEIPYAKLKLLCSVIEIKSV